MSFVHTDTCSDKKQVNQPFPKGWETLAEPQCWYWFLSMFLPMDDWVTTLMLFFEATSKTKDILQMLRLKIKDMYLREIYHLCAIGKLIDLAQVCMASKCGVCVLLHP